PPFFNSCLRFIVAAIALAILIKTLKLPVPFDSRSKKVYLILSIFSYTIPFSLVYWAEKHIPSSLASILFGMYPFFTAILSAIVFTTESLSFQRILGIILAFTGLVVIFSEGLQIDFQNYSLGMLAVVLSSFIQAGIAVFIKKYGGHLNPMSMSFVPLLLAAIVLGLLGLTFEGIDSIHFTFTSFLYVIYLGLFATVFTFSIYYWLLKKMSVVILSLSSFITPIFAILFGWLFHGEKLSDRILSGASLVLVGIIIVNWIGIKKYYHNLKFKVRELASEE
ncbi:MAG: DMT family transporter, partial [Ignavibacteria bacterium]|nr:DMT family transporter [Ignavibacteria bacterium]